MDTGSASTRRKETGEPERVREDHIEDPYGFDGLTRREMQAILLRDATHEVPDPEPVEVPPGYSAPLTLDERIALQVRLATEEAAAQEGYEDFAEFNDFTLPDDEGDWFSGYELTPMQEEYTMTYESQQPIGDGHASEVSETTRQQESGHGVVQEAVQTTSGGAGAKDDSGGGAEVDA